MRRVSERIGGRGRAPSQDVLLCPICGRWEMVVYVEEQESQMVKCARCHSLVAYTSSLIRVLDKK